MLVFVKLTTNTDADKFSYSRYGIESDSRSLIHFQILIGVKMILPLKWKIFRQCILMISKKRSQQKQNILLVFQDQKNLMPQKYIKLKQKTHI